MRSVRKMASIDIPTLYDVLSMIRPYNRRPEQLKNEAADPTVARKWSSKMKVCPKVL